jgi:hypothetical protein
MLGSSSGIKNLNDERKLKKRREEKEKKKRKLD